MLRFRPRYLKRYSKIADVLVRHGFGALADGFNLLDPIKSTIITPGLDVSGKFAKTGIPAAAIAKITPLVMVKAPAPSTKPAKKLDLNSATVEQLQELPGIGEAMAERIILYREEKGTIKRIDELKKVKGIGEKKFEKLKPHIEVK